LAERAAQLLSAALTMVRNSSATLFGSAGKGEEMIEREITKVKKERAEHSGEKGGRSGGLGFSDPLNCFWGCRMGVALGVDRRWGGRTTQWAR